MLLDRNDNVINLFEIKCYTEPYVFNKVQAEALRTKRSLFQHYSQSRKQVFLSFISVYGLVENAHSLGLIDNAMGLEVLFEN